MTTSSDRIDASAELARPKWAQRRFEFVHPHWMLADFTERLRGVTPRLAALIDGVSDEVAQRRLDDSWSIAQNLGHLADVEDLWQERLEDLRQRREIYTPADPARFRAAAERHAGRALPEILCELETKRAALVEALVNATPELQRSSAFHERLQCRMRLVDCAQFYAEHDDHHVLRIRELRGMLT